MKDTYNILIIDDKPNHALALKEALITLEYDKNNIFPPTTGEIEKHCKQIENFGKDSDDKNKVQTYFYIVEQIEKYNISAIFLDLNHNSSDASIEAGLNGQSTGEKLVKNLIKNNIYKKIPIIIYTQYTDTDIKLDPEVRNHVGESGVICTDGCDFTPKGLGTIFNKNDKFNDIKIRLEDKIIEYNKRKYHCDLAIICALDKEYKAAKKLLNNGGDWEVETNDDYELGFFKDKDRGLILKVILTSMDDNMGMVEAALRSVNLIEYAKPNIIAMTGIAGGSKDSGAYLGDVCIAKTVDNWQSGKYKEGDRLEISPEIREIGHNIGKEIEKQYKRHDKGKNLVEEFIEKDYKDKISDLIMKEIEEEQQYIEKNEEKFDEQRIKELKEKIRKKERNPEFKYVDMMTGSSLVANEKTINKEMLNRNRKAFFFDMEGYAVARVASSRNIESIIIKSIVDYGNHLKGDKWHEFACDISAHFLKNVIFDVKQKEET